MFAARLPLALLVSVFITTVAPSAEEESKVERRSVSARVDNAVGEGVGIHATKQPGEFTVPEGHTATNFKFSFHDPKSGRRLDTLSGSNIYSLTEKRYITEAADNSGLELPPGKYKFVVGGSPGASGTLSFDVGPGQAVKDDEELAKNADRIIDVLVWYDAAAEVKTHQTYYIQGTKVVGRFDQTYPSLAGRYQNGKKSTEFEAPRQQGTFEGSISGNVITGTWKVTRLPQRVVHTHPEGSKHLRMDDGEMTLNTRTVLANDGTISETVKGTGVSRSKWVGPPLHPSLPRQTSNEYNVNVPSEHLPNPKTGTWKDRQ